MTRMKEFNTLNPTGTAAGMEPVRLDVLQAAVQNVPPQKPAKDEPAPLATTPETTLAAPLVAKNLRLPADLVDFIDFVYTKNTRMKKQDAYTQAIEAFFRPLMSQQS